MFTLRETAWDAFFWKCQERFYPTALSRMELKSIGAVLMADSWNMQGLVLPPQLYWNPLILVGNLTASLNSQEGLVLCLKILKKTPLSPLPTHVNIHQQLRGIMHDDQLKDYNEFSACLPPAATCVGFDYNGLPGLFSLQQVAGSGLCFNHPVIELVRQWRIFRGSFSVCKG